MLPGLVLAALLSSSPNPAPNPAGASVEAPASVKASAETKRAKKPKPDPEVRLAELDQKRIEMHLGVRGYGRFLDADPAIGASLQLGMGVRLVRGLYVMGEVGAGAHGLPFGASGQVFVGLQHELRFSKWARPSFHVGYTHQFDASFEGDVFGPGFGGHDEHPGACEGKGHEHGQGGSYGFDLGGSAKTELASRPGVQAGVGMRFPFKAAPRLSLYVRGDVAYYFDDRPGRLQAGGTLGLQVVF